MHPEHYAATLRKKPMKKPLLTKIDAFFKDELFPSPIELSPETLALLAKIYPEVPWNKVKIVNSMPWFAGKKVIGMVLPNSFSATQAVMYLRAYNPNSLNDQCLLIHEACHVKQFYQLNKHWKLPQFGYFNAFLIQYISGYFYNLLKFSGLKKLKLDNSRAYLEHPMEVEAYGMEDLCYQTLWHYQNDYERVVKRLNLYQKGLKSNYLESCNRPLFLVLSFVLVFFSGLSRIGLLGFTLVFFALYKLFRR